MLSEEAKAEVVANKMNYSLEQLEEKLCVICVKNKVNFDLSDSRKNDNNIGNTVYNVNSVESATLPAWLQAVKDNEARMNNY